MTQLRANFRPCKKAAFPRGRARPPSRAAAKKSQRGILHVLFIVFAVLGVSLWGISEFLLSAEKESRGITAESAAVVTETKRILLNYALNPPPPVVDDVTNCGLNNEQGCYNYYAPGLPAYAKDNRATFTLPCPDLVTDGNLDGASDPGAAGCAASAAGALESETVTLAGQEVTLNHRFGRIPWRDERGDKLYVRGLGNRDLRDGAAARLWYGISRNIAPCVVQDPNDDACPFLRGAAARNGHALLALDDGWLTVVTRDDNGNEVVLSDRVAAVVISPGSAGDQTRPDEDAIFSGAGDDNQNLPTLAVVENYVEGENADGDDVFFAYGQYGISLKIGAAADVAASPTRHSEDHLEYITIDELVAAFALKTGQGDIGPAKDAAELLEGYRRRFGYYPDPAVLHADSGAGRSRPSGVLMRAAVGMENIPNIRIPVADLPPVYLAPGWRFPEREGHFDSRPSFPFNESLAKMNTRFADTPLREMAGGTNYQDYYSNAGHLLDEKDIYGLSALDLAHADTGVGAPEFDFVARSPEIRAEPNSTFRVILAAPLALNTTMTAIVEIPDGESVPPGGADVILPAGTELELQAGAETFVQFPAGLQIRGRRYRTAISAETLTQEDIVRRFPEIGIPLEVDNPFIAYTATNSPFAVLAIDTNGLQGGVGTARDGGWLRPTAPDGTQSRYRIRPEFELEGPIRSLFGTNASFDQAGFLSDTLRNYEITLGVHESNVTLAHMPHRIVLTDIRVEDIGGFTGSGILPENLRTQIFITNPRAFLLPGFDFNSMHSVVDEMTNSHLGNYFIDGVPVSRRVAAGSMDDGGEGVTISFSQMPFSRIVQYYNGGQIPECNPFCPWSGGFFADKIIVSLDVDLAAAVADTEDGEVAGVELTEQTYLPARLVDRSSDAVVNLSKAIPSRLPAVSGPMGFAPVMRAGAVMDPAFFNLHNLSALINFQNNGNAAARLYFALTVAGRGALAFTPFPPPGRPAISGSFSGANADTTVEDGLRPLPGMVQIPAGAAVGMPAGTRIILPELAAQLNLGRRFTFPDKAFAILPPGSSAMASVVAGQVRPDGTEVALNEDGLETLTFPQGGILELAGARFLAGGGKFDELAELEIRGRAQALDAGGNIVNLNDGAIVQPFTGRAISPNRMALEDGAEIVGDSRARARFTRRPLTAPRPGEPLEPTFPLMITGAVAASQEFPAGVFSNLGTGAGGEMNLTFDEDTEFLLPAGFTLTIDEGAWNAPGENYGAVELGNDTNFYNFESGGFRQDVVLSLTLPAGTRVYDKRFGPNALLALSPFAMPMAADLGNPRSTVVGASAGGQARFNFALFPESNLTLRAPGALETSIPGGAVVDVGGRAVIPPAGVMRIPRVAGDLEIVSNAEMMIYVGGGGRLEYEYAEVIRRGDQPHADGDEVAVPYRTAGNPASYGGARAALAEIAPDAANAKMNLPEGAMILIPPGDPLPLHANYLITTANAVSHMRLPQDAVMVLREGMQAQFSGGDAITGPAYVRLGGMAQNGRPAAANLILDLGNVAASGESFVMLREDAQLRARPGVRVDAPAVRIPAHARLDLYGNMEARGEPWFFNEALPAQATETLKDTPMIYAVAPECRRLSEGGKKCGDATSEGLTFEIPPGEEILLPKDTPVPDVFRVEAGDGGRFSAALYALDDLSNPPTALKNGDASYVRVGENGRIFTDGGNFELSDFLNSSLDSGRKYMVMTPPASGFRVYLGLGESPSQSERERANYVEILGRPLTIYNGGYVGDTYTAPNNLGLVVLDVNEEFSLGAGTRIFDGGMRPGAFGPGSSAPAGAVRFGTDPSAPRSTAPLDLTDYVAVNNGLNSRDFFNFEADLGAQIAKVDSLGRVEYRLSAGESVGANPGPASEFNRARAYQITANSEKVLQLAMGQTLQMEPGHLWQGYIPAGGVHLVFTRSDKLHHAYWPPSPESSEEALMQSRLLLRVHPADLALNFFGSGVETVEGLDGEAEQVPARELLAMSEALFQDFAVSDFAPASERRLRGYRVSLAPIETELLAPYLKKTDGDITDSGRPYVAWLKNAEESAGRSHGINPQILHIPPELRLSLVSHHALRVDVGGETEGSYLPAGQRGDAEAYTYNGADPLFFANWVLHSGVPVPGLTSGADFQEFTTLPANGLKVRRVRLGMDPTGARLLDRLNLPQDDHLKRLANITGSPCNVLTPGLNPTIFAQGPVPPYAERTNYPGAPCPTIGRGDHKAGFDAKFALRASQFAGSPAEPFYVNPPVLAVVREIGTGRALTVTTYWHNFYGQVGGKPTLSARMVWGANRLPLALSGEQRDAAAPSHFQHALPVDSAEIDSAEFLHDQDWDWFAFSGENRAGSDVSLTADDPDAHFAVFSGPYSHLAPDDPANVAASGLDGSALRGMCGIDTGASSAQYLRARFAAPPIQLAALDLPPGLAWPRPGRDYGTNDVDKRIKAAFISDPANPLVAHRLSPFTHIRPQNGTLAFVANPQNLPKIQNRVGRGLATGEYEEDTAQSGDTYRVRARPRNIPANRAEKARTTEPKRLNPPSFVKKIGPDRDADEFIQETTRAYSELYVFMDRPFNPEYMGGKQSFVIGSEFRVEGAAALVPPFASPRDKTAADLMAQRSKMMNDLFDLPPLPETYTNDLAGDPKCAGINPCPAMWANSAWAPVLGGVIAMEAIEMQIMDETSDQSVTSGVYFIQPQPEMVVQLADGTSATLLAGSVIYPYSGKVIPAQAPGQDAELVVSDRHAIAAVDVSPAIAPPPVRIFREKTHRVQHFDPTVAVYPRDIPVRADFHAIINVENRLFSDGKPFVENDSCPAFIQGVPAPGEVNALPNVGAGAAAFAASGVERSHHVFADNDAGIPKSRYPAIITMTSSATKAAGSDNYENMIFSHIFGDNIVAVDQIIAKRRNNPALIFITPATVASVVDGITVVVGDADPAKNLVSVIASLNALVGRELEPFSLLDFAAVDDSRRNIGALSAQQMTDNPEALFFLKVRLHKDLCPGLAPPGSFSSASNVPQVRGNVNVAGIGEGTVGRIPPSGYVRITATISSGENLVPVDFVHYHRSTTYLGFNDETNSEIIARGRIDPTIQASDPKFAAMSVACPNCTFTAATPPLSGLGKTLADRLEQIIATVAALDTERSLQAMVNAIHSKHNGDSNPYNLIVMHDSSAAALYDDDAYNRILGEAAAAGFSSAPYDSSVPGELRRILGEIPAVGFGGSDVLEIDVPVGSQILLPSEKTERVVHSFDFEGGNNADVPNLRVAGDVNAQVSGATQMGDYFSGNLVNEYYDDGAGNSQCATDGGDDIACQFHHNGAIHREFLGATADGSGQTVAYTFFFNRVPGVTRVDSVRVLPLNQAHTEEQARSGLVFSNDYTLSHTGNILTPNPTRNDLRGEANPLESSEPLDSSFRVLVEEGVTMGMTLAPAIADGLDADALWQDSRGALHSYVLGGVTLNDSISTLALSESAIDAMVADVTTRLEALRATDFTGAGALPPGTMLDAIITAITARRDGDPNFYSAITLGGFSMFHLRVFSSFIRPEIGAAGFKTVDDTLTSLEGEPLIATIPVRIPPPENTQSRGFALEITRTGVTFVAREGSFAEGFARVSLALVPFDTFSGAIAEYQDQPVFVTVAVNVPMSPNSPTLIRGVFTLNQVRPPLNVGETEKSGDRHFFNSLEYYLNADEMEAGFPNHLTGLIEPPYVRIERPISRHLPGVDGVECAGVTVAGGDCYARWNTAILGSEFHFAPTPAEISGRTLPAALMSFQARIDADVATEMAKVAPETPDPNLIRSLRQIQSAAAAWYFRESAPFYTLRNSFRFEQSFVQLRAYELADLASTAANFAAVADRGEYLSQVEEIIMQFPQSDAQACLVEPLGFLPLVEKEYDYPGAKFVRGTTVTAEVSPVAYLRWHESDSESRGYFPGRFEVLGGNVNEVKRYDGSFTRGFLATPRVAEILGEYYRGGGGWRGAASLPSGSYFAEGGGIHRLLGPVRQMGGTLNLVPADGPGETAQMGWDIDLYPGSGNLQGNEHLRLRNPLSYLWQSRRADSRHMELVGARRLRQERAHEMVRQKICRAAGGSTRTREGVLQSWCLDNQLTEVSGGITVAVPEESPYDFLPNLPTPAMPSSDPLSRRFGAFAPRVNMMMMGMMAPASPDFDLPRVRTPFMPLGVRLNSGAASDGARPIQALRLPHAIRTSVRSRIRIPAGGLGYPASGGFYAFPEGSRAMMMHMDLSSWESVHPGLVATRGGMTYKHKTAPADAVGTIAWSPAPLSAADEIPGEAFSNFDISGRRFLHYQRSESSPAEEPTSARQIYANTWIRLNSPGILERNGARTRLEQGTVLNPIAGTYVSAPRGGLRGDPNAILPYASRARSVGSTPLRLLRPALILPKGAKLVVPQGGQGVRIRKVRAAVMISPAPLKETECPAGIGGKADQTLKDSGLLLADGTEFSGGHPCAWLDEHENLNGDRVFIYRSRPRWNATNTRVEINDQMVLLGGELEF